MPACVPAYVVVGAAPLAAGLEAFAALQEQHN